MKNRFTPPARYALLTACMLSGLAHAQSINLTGDTNPSGNLGASHTATQVIVGNTGTGALSIQNGGQLTSQNGSIGEQAGSTGSVVVDGAGSSWSVASTTNYARLTAGQLGSATLRVRNGATVSSSHGLESAMQPGASALIEVDGANSTLRGNDCSFGTNGISTHRISNGGLLHCQSDAYLQYGDMTLSGAGSKWLSGNDIYIGGPTGPTGAEITVHEGTAIEARFVYLAPGVSTAPVTLNIEGTTTPGALNLEQILFGSGANTTLNLNHSDASGNYQFNPGLFGSGDVNVNGSGTTTLMGTGDYYGWTRINTGILRANNDVAFSTHSDFVVAAGATLDAANYSQVIQSLDNSGTVILGASGIRTTMTVQRNYVGNGGVIEMRTELGTDDSSTQRLVIHGDSGGNTILNISNLGGTGAATTGNGIMVVQVNGASNGTFSLPAPGHVVAGGYRYTLAKVSTDWFLQSDVHVEASGPEASVVCTPAELSDTANQVATCTVTLTAAPTADLPINLVLPAANPRYTTTCASPMVVAANATQASCTITATPNTTAGDGDVSLELAIAPPTTADAYTPAGPAAQVLIKDAGDTTQPPVTGTPTPVPTLGSFSLAALAALMGLLGLRRNRKTV